MRYYEFKTKLENLCLPIILAKKGKGDYKVVANFSVKTSSFVAPESFIKYFLSQSNNVVSPKSLENIVELIHKDYGVKFVEISMFIDLPFERMSQKDFVETTVMYRVGYKCVLYRKKITHYTWVKLPVVSNDIILNKSELTLVLEHDGANLYFEDIIFSIEKIIVPLDAALTSEEKEVLREKLKNSKNVRTILSELSNVYENSSSIQSCDIQLCYHSCILNTDICHNLEWKKK